MTRRNVRERGKQVEKCDRSWRLEVTYNPYFTYPQDENRPPLPFPSLPWPFERGSGVSGEGCIQLKSSHQCQNGQEQGSVAGGADWQVCDASLCNLSGGDGQCRHPCTRGKEGQPEHRNP